MARVRAAVLAAGRGVRMGGERPKTLLEVGDRPLLGYILEGLEQAGVQDLLVVTGFMANEIQAFVDENWSGEASYVYNARYASWGNFHSVRMAVDQSPGFDLMVVNSDIIVHPDVYRRALAKEGGLILSVQRKQRTDEEDMRVRLDGDRVLGVSKGLKRAHSHGEFCGVSVLRGGAQRVYADISTDSEWRATTHGYYEDVYNAMIGRVVARAAEVAAGEYAEIDTPEDIPGALKVVERHFLPAPA